MAGYEARPGDLTIYKEREKKNEKGPDWKGSALVVIPEGAKPGDVVKMDVAVWAKGQYGTMLGGQIKPARQIDAPISNREFSGPAGRVDPFDDNTPW